MYYVLYFHQIRYTVSKSTKIINQHFPRMTFELNNFQNKIKSMSLELRKIHKRISHNRIVMINEHSTMCLNTVLLNM